MNVSKQTTKIVAAAIDINADLGEGFPNNQALLGLVTSASICCRAHAGNLEVIRQTLCDARDRGVVVGPSRLPRPRGIRPPGSRAFVRAGRDSHHRPGIGPGRPRAKPGS